jgi:5-methyltetrahydropteroyltriglutamate--homocysteine methyltransferase
MTVTVDTLGFPRIGPKRELKTALESHWAGKTDTGALPAVRRRRTMSGPG